MVQPLRVRCWSDDVVSSLILQEEARDLTHLLADHDVAHVFWMLSLVDRVKLVARRDLREIGRGHPSDRDVAALHEVLSVGPEVGADAPEVGHARASPTSRSASVTRS